MLVTKYMQPGRRALAVLRALCRQRCGHSWADNALAVLRTLTLPLRLRGWAAGSKPMWRRACLPEKACGRPML
jgi:hypothetical protein